jgi:hypothetical protein
MTYDQLVDKVVEAFNLAGLNIIGIENRLDLAKTTNVDLKDDEGDFFNLEIDLTGNVTWFDFTHITPLGNLNDPKELLATRLQDILAKYQPQIMRNVKDLNELLA